MSIRTIIADDDAGMRLMLAKIIERCEGYELVGEAVDGKALIELYEREKPQVVITDVEMPALSGVDCARLIQDQDPRAVIIFATAHEQYMGDAFEVYAFDYLLKPFRVDRALKTLELARTRIEALARPSEVLPVRSPGEVREPPARLMIKHKEGVAFVDLDALLLVQREERATVLYAKGGERYVTAEPLGELENRLPKHLFFRSHKSYIVGLNHIEAITPYGRWTYVIQLRGTDRDALITHERFEALQKMYN